MCLAILFHRHFSGAPLALAANREEAYDRPALPPHWWGDPPVFARRDQRAGRNARDWVDETLSQVDSIVLTAHGTDSYGRYLADLRYLPGEPDPQVVVRRGQYLNRELLERHLARRYLR